MRAEVTAILVIREGGDQLSTSLQGITAQTFPISKLILVDLSADSTIGSVLDSSLGAASFEWQISSAPYAATFAEAIGEGMLVAFGRQSDVSERDWIWILRDDSEASNSALGKLMEAVESAPTVKIAGPKQREAESKETISEMGLTVSRFGERLSLVEGERDQSQHDRMSDVLAVGEVGMLVNAELLISLGGFDPAMGAMDLGLDLCIRGRLLGHRVVVVPSAIVFIGASSVDWNARKKIRDLVRVFLFRQSWLYRSYVYAPAWLLPALLIASIPWSAFRVIGQLFLKRPDKVLPELCAPIGALGKIPQVLAARKVISKQDSLSWLSVDSLRAEPSLVRTLKSRWHGDTSQGLVVDQSLEQRQSLFFGVFWLTVSLAVLSVAVFARWLTADSLQGGGLVPIAEPGSGLWKNIWGVASFGLIDGFDYVPADPAGFLYALLGSLTWWEPDLALRLLFFAAVPIAGIVAWWAFGQIFNQRWVRWVSAFLWSISPPILLSISDGRVASLIGLMSLPWFLGSIITAHLSWQRIGQASIAAVIVTAAVPSLWIPVATAVVIVTTIRAFAKPFRMIAGFLPVVIAPSALLALPRFLAWHDQYGETWWEGWGVLFADPGVAVSYEPLPWWGLLLGWPELVVTSVFGELLSFEGPERFVLLSFGGLLVLLAILSLAVGRAESSLIVGFSISLGLLSASAAPFLFSGYRGAAEVFVWPGSAVGVIILGLVVGSGTCLSSLTQNRERENVSSGVQFSLVRILGVTLAVLSLVSPGVIAAQTWAGQSKVQATPSPNQLPAIVSAEASRDPEIKTLVIDFGEDLYYVSLESGTGLTLMESSTLIRGRLPVAKERDKDLARLTAMLVQPSAADPLPLLRQYGVSFVLLREGFDSEYSGVLDQRVEFVAISASDNGYLWQVIDSPEAGVASFSPKPPWTALWVLVLISLVLILGFPSERRSMVVSRDSSFTWPAAHRGGQ